MKRVVSYSLFESDRNGQKEGNRPFYWSYVPLLLRAHGQCWPGWECWIYHDASIYTAEYGSALLRAAESGLCKMIYAGASPRVCESMLWRLRPLFEPDVEYVATRDLDSCPAPRELRYLERWIADQPREMCHMFHDSESHSGLMGGMGCFNALAFRERFRARDWGELIARHPMDLGRFGSDQEFLTSLLVRADRTDQMPTRDPHDARDHFGHLGGAIQTAGPLAWYDRHETDGRAREAERVLTDDHRYVVLASDANPTYSFFLPLTVALWRRLGYRAIVNLVGRPDNWLRPPGTRAQRLVVEEACHAGARVQWIGDPAPWYSSALAQWSRLFGHRLPRLNPASWLVTSDADMWPLNDKFFDRRTDGVALWYANAYHDDPLRAPKWPLCYIGANLNVWRELLPTNQGTGDATRAMLDRTIGIDPTRYAAGAPSWSDVQWFGDEETFGRILRAWSRFPSGVLPIFRTGCPPADRIDRSAWPARVTREGFADAHLLRPGYTDENWPRLRPLLPPDLLEWADGYRDRFLESSK